VFRTPLFDSATLRFGSGGSGARLDIDGSGVDVDLGAQGCSVGPLEAGAWHHLLCAANDDDATCFLDGVANCVRVDESGSIDESGSLSVVATDDAVVAGLRVWRGEGPMPALAADAVIRSLAFMGIHGVTMAGAPAPSPRF